MSCSFGTSYFFSPLPSTPFFFLAINRIVLILLSDLRVKKHFALYSFGSVAKRESAGVLPFPATEILLTAYLLLFLLLPKYSVLHTSSFFLYKSLVSKKM